jgi:hypothetical protein
VVEAERLSRASDLLDWWTQWENLCLPLLRSKLGQICTNFEANVGKSARNIGIDHVEPGETASHVKYQHEIL